MIGQGQHGQEGQKEENGPDPVDDGPEDAHEKGLVGRHGTPHVSLSRLFLSPAFVFAPFAGSKTDVLDYPVSGVGKGRQQEKAWKKQAEQDPWDQDEGMDAESLNCILRLAQ